jgi:hypothetical protein
MPIFLKTNTKNKDEAERAAFQMAVYYDADVCYEPDKNDGYWHVVLNLQN